MSVLESRMRNLNSKDVGEGPVVYLMARDQRVYDNWALLSAQNTALERKVPLLVVFFLVEKYPSANKDHYDFMLKGLEEVEEEFGKLDIPFIKLSGAARSDSIIEFATQVKAGAIYCDFSPLRGGRKWRNELSERSNCAVFEVDAHNIVPTWVASEKQEYSARFFRPKVHQKLNKYLVDFPKIEKHPYKFSMKKGIEQWPQLNEQEYYSYIDNILSSGEHSAEKKLKLFIKNGLNRYHIEKNDPNKDVLSGLSP